MRTAVSYHSMHARVRRRRHEHGTSLLETVAAIAVTALVLGDAAEQARTACTIVREASAITIALTSARNVLDLAIATPCAPVQNATAVCGATSRCTIMGSEVGRRTTVSGVIVLVRLSVEVTRASDAIEEPRLARLVGIAARPAVCS
jgi:hypothetical protein